MCAIYYYNEIILMNFLCIFSSKGGDFVKEMFKTIWKRMKEEFMTIPNMLSTLRLLLIPVIVYLYCFKRDNLWTLILIAISSITDVVDGFVARKFNMVTDFGKFLDPLADKATQITILACLITRFKAMIIPCVLLVVKELSALSMRLAIFKETEIVDGAKWHGKLATVVVVSTVASHLIWYDMTEGVSLAIIMVCTAFVLFSAVLYTIDNIRVLKNHGK